MFISFWLVIFLVVIAPFDIAELPFLSRLQLMPFYGVITFVGYVILLPFQSRFFKSRHGWNISLEIAFISIFNILVWLGSFVYYKSSFINGEYSFQKFTFEVYLPIFLILLSTIIFVRWYSTRKMENEEESKVILKGENRLDFLQLDFSELVCVSSADNYVEIHYLDQNVLKKKLLRSTLKQVEQSEPRLFRVHRSHLINQSHFQEWKDVKTIVIAGMEIPVSKNYRNSLHHPRKFTPEIK